MHRFKQISVAANILCSRAVIINVTEFCVGEDFTHKAYSSILV